MGINYYVPGTAKLTQGYECHLNKLERIPPSCHLLICLQSALQTCSPSATLGGLRHRPSAPQPGPQSGLPGRCRSLTFPHPRDILTHLPQGQFLLPLLTFAGMSRGNLGPGTSPASLTSSASWPMAQSPHKVQAQVWECISHSRCHLSRGMSLGLEWEWTGE